MAVKDEFRLHLYYLTKLITKYSRILLYGPFGEGKATLLKNLKKKFPDVNFYLSPGGPIKEPFVCALLDPNQPRIPEFDIIYCMQYSTEYKEDRTGYKFPKGEWRPMVDYIKKINDKKKKDNNLSGKTFKALDKLREAIS